MLKWVDIISYDAEKRKGDVAVRCILENGKVRIEGDEKLKTSLEEGIALGPGNKVMPADGEAFLEALGREFKGGHLFATEVREGDDVEKYETPPMRDVKDLPPAPPHVPEPGQDGGPPPS